MAELMGFVKVICEISAFEACASGIASSHWWESSRQFSFIIIPKDKWFRPMSSTQPTAPCR